MTKPNDSAYPAFIFENERAIGSSEGLTKREYFAAMALQGLLCSVRWQFVRPDNFWEPQAPWSDLVKDAVTMADALIADLDNQ